MQQDISVQEYKWYAIYTRSRAEKKVVKELEYLEIESYFPVIKRAKKWSDRVKIVEVPLLSSYVFVKVSNKEHQRVLTVSNVVCYITFEGKAVSIPDAQINNLKVICKSKFAERTEVLANNFEQGEQVKISDGDFKGFEGEIVHSKGVSKLVVRLSHLNYSIAIEIDANMLEKIQD